jgi:GTPase Era involved in 16S rRNA processing
MLIGSEQHGTTYGPITAGKELAMSKRGSKASLSKGRTAWCVIYYHPVAKTADGKPKRVRRGLGTSDENRAQALVDQVNELIEDASMHNPTSRERAAAKFDREAVVAFFVPMQPELHDPWAIRDAAIPLPGGRDANDGYARALFVGTTGAGKTTLVRQLLGTDPLRERFPLTSAAKATTADMEVILRAGDFQAVVTFMPRDQVRQYIAECLQTAVVSALDDAPERDVVRRFQEHNDMRFRLKYILGDLLTLRAASQEQPVDEDDDDEAADASTPAIPQDQRDALLAALEGYMESIRHLADASKAQRGIYAKDLGVDLKQASREEQEVLQEFVEDWLADSEDFHDLVDTVFEDVESRFDHLGADEIERGKDNWPIKWTFTATSDKRAQFLATVNRFSSNYAPSFGRLLTPLVDGIRVAGPFAPDWYEEGQPKLVLLDGQGIGHTADSSSSVSTSITRRFRLVDAIVLVDNAAQPMQAAPCAVLQAVVASGHESKLIIAFTHFDEVKADNLIGRESRKYHVVGSFENATHAVGKALGREAEVSLRRLSTGRIVFLANIQSRLDPSLRGDTKFTIGELRRLITAIGSMVTPVRPVSYKPFYHVANLVLAVQNATQSFQSRESTIVRSEHWTRVKALTRRLGFFPDQDGYDTLLPVADLWTHLLNALFKFLSEPVAWQPSTPAEDSEERAEVIARIRQEIETRLLDLARKRIKEERLKEWIVASARRGPGSGIARKDDVLAQYGVAAPTPSNEVWAVVLRDTSGEPARGVTVAEDAKFLLGVCNLIAEAVQAGGGVLRGWTPPSGEKASE